LRYYINSLLLDNHHQELTGGASEPVDMPLPATKFTPVGLALLKQARVILIACAIRLSNRPLSRRLI
jgi:hypothetical protein